MAESNIVVPGVPQRRYTEKEILDAAEDTRLIVASSPVVQACVAVDIITRQLYVAMRGVLEHELQHGWDVQNVELVIQTLIMSSQEKANEPFSIVDLRRAVLETAIPFLNILAAQERENPATSTPPNEVPSGDSPPESP